MTREKKGVQSKSVTIAGVPRVESTSYPAPFADVVKGRQKQVLGDLFGLTQYGVIQVTLLPGAQSALRHWHSQEDEFVYLLSGALSMIDDAGETVLGPGQCIGFQGGSRNAHHLVNRGTIPAVFLVVGSRIPGDNAFYPDDDLMWVETADGVKAAHKDGKFY